jgi:hypothetical protein
MWVPAVRTFAWRRVGEFGAMGEVVGLVGQVDGVVVPSAAEGDVAGFAVEVVPAE